MNKSKFFGLFAFFVLFGTQASAGYQAINIYSTGVDDSGKLLAGGALDTHYALSTAVTPNSAPNAYVVKTPDPGWVGNTATSQWINSLGYAGTQNNGAFTYTTTFNLAGYDPTTASLIGKVAADDQVMVYLNGQANMVAINGSSSGSTSMTVDQAYNKFYNFSVTQGFQAGLNTLTFVTYNNHGGPAGLQAQLAGTANSVPEPASMAMLGLGLVGVGLMARRRRSRNHQPGGGVV